MTRSILGAALCGIALVISGCSTKSDLLLDDVYKIDDGVVAEQPKFLPVPDGMRLLDEYHQSHTHRVGEYLHADLVYRGGNSVIQVTNYIIGRFTTERFELLERDASKRRLTKLRFRRGRYVVNCEIERNDELKQTFLRYGLRTETKV